MSDRNNTIAGWVLAGGIAALGLSIVSGKIFHADKHQRPEVMGYPIEGVETVVGKKEVPMSVILASSDVAAGEKVFKKCVACHTINSGGADGIGPNLYAIFGKKHGGVAGFAYSSALTDISGTWNFDNMNAWLISPRKYAPGTKMTFAGLGKPQDRANLMAYLNAQGSNMAMPEVPAEEPVEAEDAAIDAAAEAEATDNAEAEAAGS